MWHFIHINELLILVLSCDCLKKARTQETFWLLTWEFLSLEGCSHICPQIYLWHIVQQGRDKPFLWELALPTLVFWWHFSPGTRGIMHTVEQDSSLQASHSSGSWLVFWEHQPLQDWFSFQHMCLSERNHSTANAAVCTAGFKSSIVSTL